MHSDQVVYKLSLNKYFLKKVGKMIKKNKNLEEKIDKALEVLIINPYYYSLKTHKVESKNFGEKYSSRITGDIRIIWNFDKTTKIIEIIEIFDIGGHDGSSGVY